MAYGVRITLAYDGTQFAGFQRQPDERTVQSVLEEAIAKITQEQVAIRGAGRTDAGVHAEGQIVAFDSERALSPQRWLKALNRYLPDDASVQAVTFCEPGYHPRFDALDKTYRYLFHLGLARDPLLRLRAWQLGRSGAPRGEGAEAWAQVCELDLTEMQSACTALIGTHDFRAFRSADDRRDNTLRTIYSATLVPDYHERRNLLALEVRGSAFMKNMVRVIAGTLIAVGRQKLTAAEIAALLGREATRHRWMETAPAHGLTLVRVTLGRLRAQASH